MGKEEDYWKILSEQTSEASNRISITSILSAATTFLLGFWLDVISGQPAWSLLWISVTGVIILASALIVFLIAIFYFFRRTEEPLQRITEEYWQYGPGMRVFILRQIRNWRMDKLLWGKRLNEIGGVLFFIGFGFIACFILINIFN